MVISTHSPLELKLQFFLLEKAVANKDIKQIQKVSNSVRKFKKVIKFHHLKKVFATLALNINFDNPPDFDPAFSEEFEIQRPFLTKF